jgi:hypothetical protein
VLCGSSRTSALPPQTARIGCCGTLPRFFPLRHPASSGAAAFLRQSLHHPLKTGNFPAIQSRD